MKIYLNKPRYHWISPYKILEKVFFWREIDYDEPIIERLSNILEPISLGIQKVLNIIHPKINYIKIDRWDTWSMDHTLTPVILPMLKQLKETKHGSPIVDIEDVPESMRTSDYEEYESQQCFDFYHEPNLQKIQCGIHERWDWVIDQMIWSFEQIQNNSEDQFHTGTVDWKSVPCEWDENGKPTMYRMEDGPNHTAKFDIEGYLKHQEKIQVGLKLFGKYYRNLWD